MISSTLEFGCLCFFYFTVAAASFSFPQSDSSAADDEIYSEIIENLAEDTEEESDFLTDELESLSENPVNLNKADFFELQRLPMMSARLAEGIIKYRKKTGRIFSLNELINIEGFNSRLIRIISPFVTLNNAGKHYPDKKSRSVNSNINLELRSRLIYNIATKRGFSEDKFAGTRPKYYNRLKINYRKSGGINILTEKDEGESKINDFGSFSIWGRDIYFIKNIIIGDYYIEAGQGLVLWSAYSPPAGLDIFSSALRNHTEIKPYTSSGEYGYFRGFAGSFLFNKINIIAFYSDNLIDANIDSSTGIISSLKEDGYHRTANELSKKGCCREITKGFIAEFRLINSFKAGFIFINSKLDKPLEAEYKYPSRNFLNYSFFWDLYVKSLKIYGEAGYDRHRLAVINSIQFIISKSISSVVSIRYYSPDYTGVHAMGFGNGSATRNEIGHYAGISIDSRSLGKFIFYYDLFKNPLPGYNNLLPGGGCKAALAWISPNFSGSELKIRYKYSLGEVNKVSENHTSTELRSGNKIKIEFKKPGPSINLKSGIEYTWLSSPHEDNIENGFMIYQDISWLPFNFLRIYGRAILFGTGSFKTAVYEFENDLKGIFKSSALSGNGERWYLMAKIIIRKGLVLSIKYSETYKPNMKSLGSGYSEIQGDTDNCVGCQLDFEL